MAELVQLIVGGVQLPETSHDRYSCYPAELGIQVDMISGRRVQEVRGHVQMISYSCDYLTDAMWRQLATVLRSGQPITVVYLPDDGSSMLTSEFLTESLDNPTFAFSRHGAAYWHNVSFTLREVRPHD